MMMKRIPLTFSLCLGACMAAFAGDALAAEGGTGFYLLGTKGPAAAILPPPGIFFSNDMYFYSGELGGGKKFETGGKIAVGVSGKAFVEIPTILVVLPENLLGGKVGLALTTPIGWKNTSADAVFQGPHLGRHTFNVSDDVTTFGDPVVTGMLSWDQGNFHWQIGTMINVPAGDYQRGELSNMSFHHWGADFFAAGTYFDPATGWDFSGALGMTVNAENPTTDYRTGNEFHLEGAVSKHFNEQFSAGVLGYYYEQVTGDSGDGAILGPFKGRVAALGATVGWNFHFGEVPVQARLKYYHEFAAENRAEGDAVFATVSMPLTIFAPAK